MRNILKNKKGFTLVEIIIVIAIVGFVAISLVSFILAMSASKSKADSINDLNMSARIAMQEILKTIRASNGVNTASSTFDIDPGVLSLSMASSSLNPTVIRLNQDNGILQISEGIGSFINLTASSTKVSNLVFNFFSGGMRESVRIFMTIENLNQGSNEFQNSVTVTSTITLRN